MVLLCTTYALKLRHHDPLSTKHGVGADCAGGAQTDGGAEPSTAPVTAAAGGSQGLPSNAASSSPKDGAAGNAGIGGEGFCADIGSAAAVAAAAAADGGTLPPAPYQESDP